MCLSLPEWGLSYYGLVGVDVCYNYAGVADISYSNIAPLAISE